MTQHHQQLQQKIEDRTAIIGIVGLGYVGLPLAEASVAAGYGVLGFDIDPTKVAALERGDTYLKHLPSEWLKPAVDAGSLRVTADMNRLDEPDVIILCVPTPVTKSRDPDLSYIESTSADVAKRLRPGQLVSLESTTYPGTTRDVVVPILERSGLKPEVDFFVGYSPEREDPGNKSFKARNIPKLVGGIGPHSSSLANAAYSRIVSETVPVSSCEVAEAAKILENTYRAVNIALVNELKVLFAKLGIDVWEVVEAAKTKPFGFQAFYPGPGLGGHCIPVDPFYLSWLAKRNDVSAHFIELAGEVNRKMPRYVVDRVAEALNENGKPVRGSKVLLLGLAYKKDVDDTRESPSFELFEQLRQRGAEIAFSDPHVASIPAKRDYDLPAQESVELTPETLAAQDCVLIATDHTKYDYELIAKHAPLIVDTRNALAGVEGAEGKVWKA
ncbi:UDP-N-acetyl-D-glucosamine 6-dehydrogenase [Planctomycetes bacterium MalM25]|nr:UDP-N-acetyl-D-glucosamine 6-dehydrogenase [Planctomycetes bacterium MalM25]